MMESQPLQMFKTLPPHTLLPSSFRASGLRAGERETERLNAGLAWPRVSHRPRVYLPVSSISEHMFTPLADVQRQPCPISLPTDLRAPAGRRHNRAGQTSH